MSLSIFDAARDAPHAPALRVGELELTFAELAERVSRRLDRLHELGLRLTSSRPVALLAHARLETLETLYALLSLEVPVLPIHSRLTEVERQVLLDASGANLVFDGEHADVRPTFPRAEPELGPERTLAVVATSGSSGRPKLVILPERAFVAAARASHANLSLGAGDRWLLCLPLAHVGGLSIVTRCLIHRAQLVLFQPGPAGLLASSAELAQALDAERISLVSLVPTLLERLLALEPTWRAPTSLRAVLLGGAGAPPSLLERSHARGVPVLTSYGLTEGCSQVTTRPYASRAAPIPVEQGVPSSGFPLPGISLRIVGGLIHVRGDTLCAGYLGEASPLDDDGWLCTGDRGRYDDARGLFVFGRAGDLIVSGGENIDPSEVEAALLRVPGVSAACVFGVEDSSFGQIVAAALEVTSRTPLDPRLLSTTLEARLAAFKRPRLIAELAELPRTATGKLDRQQTRRAVSGELRPLGRPPRGIT